jgi:peptide-methionine (R)-S-oxide reductase
MNRRTFLSSLVAGGTLPFLPRAWANGPAFRVFHDVEVSDEALARLSHDRRYWRDLLSESAWRVLFLEDTERPFSSPLDEQYANGTYICAACYLPLFSSATKYNSSTGWPSFWQPFEAHVGTKRDFKLIWPRTEYHCIRCGGHQGHVFNDGPQPTGQRWCNNGLALHFVPAGEALPGLRG